ncbi:MAG: 2-succinyl-5-enolpyruvyl-6-hydroxy-3-cyclohexene-1-carboxylic-acid synthase [Motiliproteus sp.]
MLSDHQPSLNQLWANLLLEELCRHGIQHLCLAPGSRSTPLVMAADNLSRQSSETTSSKQRLLLHHHFDERGLGFLALGIAKASQQPVAILTTSGTAVANLYPAVIEAAQTDIPLIIISADRPPRLHECGANQAIDQYKIFAKYPRHDLYLPPPQIDFPAERLLQQLSTALRAIKPEVSPGVCHINCMYDEPLYPGSETIDFSVYLSAVSDWRDSGQPFQSAEQCQSPLARVQPDCDQWHALTRQTGVIVVGALPDHGTAAAVKALGQRLGWPLLVDIQSQLKTDADCLGLADLLLCDKHARLRLDNATHLLQFGNRLVSKRLQRWTDQQPWQQFWLVHPGDKPLAPGLNSSQFFASEIGPWCRQALAKLVLLPEPQSCIDLAGELALELQSLNRGYEKTVHQQFAIDISLSISASQSPSAPPSPSTPPALTELSAVYQLLQLTPSTGWLLAGNSLSIRLLDLVGGACPNVSPPQIFANRGASGIDGLVSTALGISLGNGKAGTLLLGDYSLLYDLNALALLGNHPQPLVIVVLNNYGGGIFRMLPVADETLRQQHYQRPHGLTFEDACRMFTINYHQPRSLGQFISHYQHALAANSSCLIEVSADARITEQQIRALTTVGSSDP